MKPINARELRSSYILFVTSFLILLTYALICLYFYFATQDYENKLLRLEADRTEQLMSERRSVNLQFELILARFEELSRFATIDAEETDNHSLMLEDVQASNSKIREIVSKYNPKSGSFLMYNKMSMEVAYIARLQDSLFNTRFELQSIKGQLGSCLKVNQFAKSRLSLGIFGR